MGSRALISVALLLIVLFIPDASSTETDLLSCSGLKFIFDEWSMNGIATGSGTRNDPYLVSGLDFDMRSGDGLIIENSTSWIVISTCRFFYANDSAGILILNSSHVTIGRVVAFGCGVGIRIGNSSDVSVLNSTSYGGHDGVEISRSNGIGLSDCIFTYNDANGMVAFDSNEISIFNCSLDVNSPRLGSDQALLMENCSGVRILSSTFRMNYGNGITFIGSDKRNDLVLEGCTIENNVNGVCVWDSMLTVLNSTFESNTDGIFLQGCTDSLVMWCNFNDNYKGVLVYDSTYIGIQNCSFNKNEDCIAIRGSSLSWVIYNEFKNNTGLSVAIGSFGIIPDNSTGNLITRNLFLDHQGSRDHVLDMGMENSWSDCVKGNYWGDHQGADDDGDGLVDESRKIIGSANSSDIHPMVMKALDRDVQDPERDERDPGSDRILIAFDGIVVITLLGMVLVKMFRGRSQGN